jgi:hypothetical protein
MQDIKEYSSAIQQGRRVQFQETKEEDKLNVTADELTEIKDGAASVTDSIYNKQTKSLRMKMNVKLSRAKDNVQRRLGPSSSVP